MRRLFLCAGYDSQNIVGPSLVWQLSSLAACGDVVFEADSDMPEAELGKIRPYCLHCRASRHGAYDFGSYRNAYLYASGALSLNAYDVLYLVNDSVFGPLSDNLEALLQRMELMNLSAFSLVFNPHHRSPHMQSWFVGLRPDVFMSGWFASFIAGVKAQKDKSAVCELYENGLSQLVVSHGLEVGGLFVIGGKDIYNRVAALGKMGLPFVKKSSFTRHCGCLGRQLRQRLDLAPADCRNAIMDDIFRLYGKEQMQKTLAGSALAMVERYLKYLVSKI